MPIDLMFDWGQDQKSVSQNFSEAGLPVGRPPLAVECHSYLPEQGWSADFLLHQGQELLVKDVKRYLNQIKGRFVIKDELKFLWRVERESDVTGSFVGVFLSPQFCISNITRSTTITMASPMMPYFI